MTKAEAISRVRVGIKELNADSRLTKKYIFSSLQSKIRILISQNSDGLKLIRDNTIFQTLKCVKLSPVPTIDECCGIKTKCQIWRTDDRLPKMYTDEDGVIVKNIVSIDGTTDFDLTTPTAIRRMLLNVNSKYDTNKYCFYSDGYLYVVKEKVPLLKIEAYFDDSIEKYNKKCDACKDCIKNCPRYLDTEWKVPKKLEELIISQTITELMNGYKRVQEDDTVNKNNKK